MGQMFCARLGSCKSTAFKPAVYDTAYYKPAYHDTAYCKPPYYDTAYCRPAVRNTRPFTPACTRIEQEALKDAYASLAAEMAISCGRRGLGKTALIRKSGGDG